MLGLLSRTSFVRYSGRKTMGLVATILIGAIQSTWVAHAVTFRERNSPSTTNSNSTKETNRFSIVLEQAKPLPGQEGQIRLQITVKNLTDDLLLLRSFRDRNVDSRVVLKRGSSQVMQRPQENDGSLPIVHEGSAMAVKPHSTTKEIIRLNRLYDLSSGSYTVYVMEDDYSTKSVVRSNTVSLDIQ